MLFERRPLRLERRESGQAVKDRRWLSGSGASSNVACGHIHDFLACVTFIHPRLDLIERKMQTRFLVITHGVQNLTLKGGTTFFCIDEFFDGFFHDRIRRTPLALGYRSDAFSKRCVQTNAHKGGCLATGWTANTTGLLHDELSGYHINIKMIPCRRESG